MRWKSYFRTWPIIRSSIVREAQIWGCSPVNVLKRRFVCNLHTVPVSSWEFATLTQNQSPSPFRLQMVTHPIYFLQGSIVCTIQIMFMQITRRHFIHSEKTHTSIAPPSEHTTSMGGPDLVIFRSVGPDLLWTSHQRHFSDVAWTSLSDVAGTS